MSREKRKMMQKALPVGLGIAIAIAGIGWYLLHGSERSSPTARPAGQPAQADARPPKGEARAPSPQAQPLGATGSVGGLVKEPGADNPYLKELQSADRKAAFERLAALGNPIAAKTAFELSMACALYGDTTYASTLQRIEAGLQPPEVKAQQKAIAARERAKCAGFDSAAFSKGNELVRFAYEKGDPRGFALIMPAKGPIPEYIAAAQEASRLNDPLALREIGGFFMRRPDVPRSVTYDLGDGLGVRSEIIRDAFYLAACAHGEDCGPNNGQLSARCVNAGFCQASSLEESFLRYTYSPADADRLLYAKHVVLTAIQTGRWPPHFWDPRALK